MNKNGNLWLACDNVLSVSIWLCPKTNIQYVTWGDKMRKVELRMNEQLKYEVIKELVDHNGNKNRASKKLNLSIRQINRLIKIYKEKGKAGFVHGNRTRKPINALDKSISEDIVLLYKHKYQDFNFRHFKEYLEEEENIHVSYKFIYNTLTKADILSPKARRRTKRDFKKTTTTPRKEN